MAKKRTVRSDRTLAIAQRTGKKRTVNLVMKMRFLLDENLPSKLKSALLRLNLKIDIMQIGEENMPTLGTLACFSPSLSELHGNLWYE